MRIQQRESSIKLEEFWILDTEYWILEFFY